MMMWMALIISEKNIVLDADQSLVVGCEQIITAKGTNPTQGINYFGAIVTGEDMRNAYVLQTPNMQTITRHLPDEASDTTCFINFTTAATGNLGVKTNTNMTFNSNTGVVTFASAVLTTADINGGTADNVVIGGTTPATATAGSGWIFSDPALGALLSFM